MTKAALTIPLLLLLAGCDGGSPGTAAAAPDATDTTSPADAGDVAKTPVYPIDPGAAATLAPDGGYAITANGQGDWVVTWKGLAGNTITHLTGTVACPTGCAISATFQHAVPGDSITTPAPNRVAFDATADATTQQQLQIATTAQAGATEPVTFDLQIDGAPALGSTVIFSAGGVLSTNAAMPFSLSTQGGR